MDKKLTEAVSSLRAEGLTSTRKAILVYLALHADREGKNIFPGVATIAGDTYFSIRTVKSVLAWLEVHEYLIPDGRTKENHIRRYRLNLDKLPLEKSSRVEAGQASTLPPTNGNGNHSRSAKPVVDPPLPPRSPRREGEAFVDWIRRTQKERELSHAEEYPEF